VSAHEPTDRGRDTVPATRAGRGVVGYAPGIFDMFHVGHLNILRRAWLQCHHLVAGVVSDEAARQVKGRWPVVPEEERLAVVDAMRFVDRAILEWTSDRLAIWEALRFDVLYKGDDWKGSAAGLEQERQFARVGVDVVYLPYTSHTSTTRLRSVTRND